MMQELHDIARATYEECLLFIKEYIQNSLHLRPVYPKKVTVNFFSGHPLNLYIFSHCDGLIQMTDVRVMASRERSTCYKTD